MLKIFIILTLFQSCAGLSDLATLGANSNFDFSSKSSETKSTDTGPGTRTNSSSTVQPNSSRQYQNNYFDIDIDTEKNDCIEGEISMDVEVEVNGEDFKFKPSCSFTFSKTFETKSGIKCKVESGMCSSFSGRGKLEVDCEGHNDESVDILCTPEKVDINIDLDDCEKKNDSIDVTVFIDNERFSFDPPCNAWSWDEDFKTKLGVKCEIEADLCHRSSRKEGEIEVDCGRSEETKKVKCPKLKQ